MESWAGYAWDFQAQGWRERGNQSILCTVTWCDAGCLRDSIYHLLCTTASWVAGSDTGPTCLTDQQTNSTPNADRSEPVGRVRRPRKIEQIDDFMASNPWHPRIVPFLVYISLLPVVAMVLDWKPAAYPLIYGFQCGLVTWLLWRYRKLLPELNLRFHSLAVPVGVGVCGAWVAMGWWMADEWQPRLEAIQAGELASAIDYDMRTNEPGRFARMEPHPLATLLESSVIIGWTAMVLRLIGMSLVVPMFEELFIRSLLLRGVSSLKRTGVGLLRVLLDMPVIGDMLIRSTAGIRASEEDPMFTRMFNDTPIGKITVFGLFASTIVFTMRHAPRDYAACLMCAFAYCYLLWVTNRGEDKHGLGPVIWAHRITNALLWVYTVNSGDWQFL